MKKKRRDNESETKSSSRNRKLATAKRTKPKRLVGADPSADPAEPVPSKKDPRPAETSVRVSSAVSLAESRSTNEAKSPRSRLGALSKHVFAPTKGPLEFVARRLSPQILENAAHSPTSPTATLPKDTILSLRTELTAMLALLDESTVHP
ncbi:MAG TPA: hypothetical protein PKE31_18485 [Pseudomonadota bacterium]|jgi:hypothetical protein|nr:hypothetical protein [Pseudomonadota bacterium]